MCSKFNFYSKYFRSNGQEKKVVNWHGVGKQRQRKNKDNIDSFKDICGLPLAEGEGKVQDRRDWK